MRVVHLRVSCERAIFNRALEALLAEASIDERLARARDCLEQLEAQANELDPGLLSQLRCIIADVARKREQRASGLSPEDELELTEKLFSLYLDASDGMLIP